MGINIVFVGLLAACCLYAWWGGGAPERIGAAIFAAGSALSHFAFLLSSQRFREVEAGILLVDVATFLAFLALAMRANRFWPIWMSGLLGVGIVAHLAMKLSPQILPYAYRFILSAWSYPMLALIAIGTWQHRKQLKACGADRSWSSFSHPDGPQRPAPPPGA